MPLVATNGTSLSYEESGHGDPVLLIMGTGSLGRVWNLHQVPALNEAGYRTITFDNRGISPLHDQSETFTLHDMVCDTIALIEQLDLAPCSIVGTSLGAFITQELLVARPDLVKRAVLVATRGRTDALRAAMSRADLELHSRNTPLPPLYDAVVRATQNLSPASLNNDEVVQDWIDVLEMSPQKPPGLRAQLALDMIPNRLAAYGSIRIPTLVIAFQDDIITPPHLGKEVADAIPDCGYQEIADCGHFGYLERPDAVNTAISGFLRETSPVADTTEWSPR
ncbi:alpha/beta fold hydrolase [Streptomyces sp. NPDC057496]|uniref:alpha/beta fold hydrolase n=1 Tax=Streptomyces sp. NPDC057496 TaxID=3346149 RepID=UPI0036930353